MLNSEAENENWKYESPATAGKIAYYNRAGEIVRVSREAVERAMDCGNVLAFVTPAEEAEFRCEGGREKWFEQERERAQKTAESLARRLETKKRREWKRRGWKLPPKANDVNKQRRWEFWHRIFRYTAFVSRRWNIGGPKSDFYHALNEAFVVCTGGCMFGRKPSKATAAKIAREVLKKIEASAHGKSYSHRANSDFFVAGVVHHPRTRVYKAHFYKNIKEDTKNKILIEPPIGGALKKGKLSPTLRKRISRGLSVLRHVHFSDRVKFSTPHAVNWVKEVFRRGKKWAGALGAYEEALGHWHAIAKNWDISCIPSGMFRELNAPKTWDAIPDNNVFTKKPRKRDKANKNKRINQVSALISCAERGEFMSQSDINKALRGNNMNLFELYV